MALVKNLIYGDIVKRPVEDLSYKTEHGFKVLEIISSDGPTFEVGEYYEITFKVKGSRNRLFVVYHGDDELELI